MPGVLEQHHQRQVGGQPLHALEGDEREAHHPHRRVGAVPAELLQHLDQPALDEARVAGRVLGLDGQLHRPVVVAAVSSRRCRVSTPSRSGSRSGASSSRSAHGFFQDGEVELGEVRELHRGDHGLGAGRPPQVAVVDADQVPVGGQPDIALECVGALLERREVGP